MSLFLLWQKKIRIARLTTLETLTSRKYLLDVGHPSMVTLCKIIISASIFNSVDRTSYDKTFAAAL